MQIIRHALDGDYGALPRVPLRADRHLLAKRRWRGTAEDGTEFGFDGEHALPDGAAFFVSDAAVYVLEQGPEPVLEVALGSDPAVAARLGWLVGNLHFTIEIIGDFLWVADDSAIRQMLAREGLAFAERTRVFHPMSGGHAHHHD